MASLPYFINLLNTTLPNFFASSLVCSLVRTLSIASPAIILSIASLPNCLATCANAILATPVIIPIVYIKSI